MESIGQWLASRATRWLRARYERFKVHVHELQPIISAVVGVMTVWIGIQAYHIDRNMQENALREARINRSVALARLIVSDDEFRELQRIGHQLEWKIDELKGRPGIDPQALHAKLGARRMGADEENLRFLIMRLMQHAARAENCLSPDEQDNVLCDEKSMLTLAGEPIFEAFFAFRPILFCDSSLEQSKGDLLDFVERYIGHDAEGAKTGATNIDFDIESYCDHYTAEAFAEFVQADLQASTTVER